MIHQKLFPIQTKTACQLKWNWSSVYLNTNTTASCCVAHRHKFNTETFDFHNTESKIKDREKMLLGQWPDKGCNHCKIPEENNRYSDRLMFNNWPGYRAPPELDADHSATHVTPRILEIYFSNICNLKCIYCSEHFSSKINEENRKNGAFELSGVKINSFDENLLNETETIDKMLAWLGNNIEHLDTLRILGGEPLYQKELFLLVDFLKSQDVSNLSFGVQSNLMLNPEKFKLLINTLTNIKFKQIFLTASIDSWGAEAEYVRSGLDLTIFQENFEYVLKHTNITLQLHTTINALSITGLPDLIEYINQWNQIRRIYWGIKPVGGREYLDYKILGNLANKLGLDDALKKFDTFGDPELTDVKKMLMSISESCANLEIDVDKIKKLKIYLTELDRRRHTNFNKTFEKLFLELDAV